MLCGYLDHLLASNFPVYQLLAHLRMVVQSCHLNAIIFNHSQLLNNSVNKVVGSTLQLQNTPSNDISRESTAFYYIMYNVPINYE